MQSVYIWCCVFAVTGSMLYIIGVMNFHKIFSIAKGFPSRFPAIFANIFERMIIPDYGIWQIPSPLSLAVSMFQNPCVKTGQRKLLGSAPVRTTIQILVTVVQNHCNIPMPKLIQRWWDVINRSLICIRLFRWSQVVVSAPLVSITLIDGSSPVFHALFHPLHDTKFAVWEPAVCS